MPMPKSKRRQYSKRNNRNIKNKRSKRSKRNKRSKRRTNRKRLTKKKLQIGGSMKLIMNNLLYILQNDVIEFLPSTKLININKKHYLDMVDYRTLQDIVDNNIELKKSPTIQQLFNYTSFNLGKDSNIVFDYKKIECDNILNNTHRNNYLSILFFYLLECNISIDRSVQSGGSNDRYGYRPDIDEPVFKGDEGIFEEKWDTFVPLEEKKEEPLEPKKEEPLEEEAIIDLERNKDKEEDIPIETESIKLVEKGNLPGFKEYENLRDKLRDQANLDNKGQLEVSNSNFVFHNVNWFNVCLGIDHLDYIYEDLVDTEIKNMGFEINKEDLNQKVLKLLENNDMKTELKSAIHTRLFKCSKKPQSFMDRIFGKISFSSCIKCDLRGDNAILHLYEEYKSILNNNTTEVNNMDLTIILVYCEVRQRMLSYNISMELLRRNNRSIRTVHKILRKLYNLDLPEIKKKDKNMNEEIRKNNEIMEERRKDQMMIINRQEELINNNQMMEKRIEDLKDINDDEINELKEFFRLKSEKNNNFINKNEGYLDKLNDELNLENKVGGGLIKKTKDKLAKECLQINETGSIDLETLGSMDNCIIR